MSRGLIVLIVVIAVIAAVGIIPAVIGDRAETAAGVSTALPQSRSARQPGPAPAGKVWSAEHGHWHDAPRRTVLGMPPADGAQNQSPVQIIPNQVGGPPAAPRPLTPQPPGEVPAGKVWSAEHGHWHDAQAQ